MNLIDVVLFTVLNTLACLVLPKVLCFALSARTQAFDCKVSNVPNSKVKSDLAIASLEAIMGVQS